MQLIGQIIRIENSSIHFSNLLITKVNLASIKLFELKNYSMFHFANFYLENISYIGNSTLQFYLFDCSQSISKGFSNITNLTIQRFDNKNGTISNPFFFSLF